MNTDNTSSLLQEANKDEQIKALKEALAEKSEEIKRLRDSTPSSKEQPEGQQEQELRFTSCSGDRACDEFVIHMEDDDGKWFKTILGGKFARLVFQADLVRKAATCRKMLEELLESWSDEWTEATTERVKQTIKSAKEWTEETSSPAVQPVEWDSLRLIGRVRERHKELIEKAWDWRSFYNGWLEGRVDMWAQNKGIAYPNELPEEPAPVSQGEIPEKIEKMIDQAANEYQYKLPHGHEFTEEDHFGEGAEWMYHKMQEEIQDYRNALKKLFYGGVYGEDESPMSEASRLLAKYPQGKEGGK